MSLLWAICCRRQNRADASSGPSLNDPPNRVPPPPTPLKFPPCPELTTDGATSLDLSQLEYLFRVKHIKLLTEEHLHSINVEVQNNCTIDELVPKDYLPPASWQDKPGTNGEEGKQAGPASNQMLSNGAAVPGHEAFYNRMMELAYTTDEAYNALSRLPGPPERPFIRVTQFRRFWGELQVVGTFWDSSKDNVDYNDSEVQRALEVQKEEANTQSPKRERGARQGSPDLTSKPPPQSSRSPTSMVKEASNPSKTKSGSASPSVSYTGRRHGAGSEMPSRHRDDLIRTFVEPVAWSFGCVTQRTMTQPCLRVGTTRLLADHAMRVFRGPQDRQRSRAQIVEGPLMAIQCTHDTAFADAGDSDVDYLARELGALLVIAQERDREGKSEISPGVGQWWVDSPRWGGGSGDAMGTPLVEDDGTKPESESDVKSPSSDDEGRSVRSRSMKQQTKKNLLARSHKPPNPVWEKRVDYMRVGKAPDDEFDTVYMLSTLNHHIALVRLHVHPQFLTLLDHTRPGESLATSKEPEAWYGVKLARSKWFDLFQAGDRVELMRALWGVMGWLMRDTGATNVNREQADGVKLSDPPVQARNSEAMDTRDG